MWKKFRAVLAPTNRTPEGNMMPAVVAVRRIHRIAGAELRWADRISRHRTESSGELAKLRQVFDRTSGRHPESQDTEPKTQVNLQSSGKFSTESQDTVPEKLR